MAATAVNLKRLARYAPAHTAARAAATITTARHDADEATTAAAHSHRASLPQRFRRRVTVGRYIPTLNHRHSLTAS